jgi:Ribosome biogenesis protein Nop16
VLKPHWDASKTPAANLASLGLLAHPNKAESSTAITSRTTSEPATRAVNVIELFDVPESDGPSRRSCFPLNKEEEEYIAKCMQKWGDNYTRMFRDIKVNTMQHTEEKLRKMGSRFLLLSPEQRRVEVPESVQHLLPNNNESE